MRYMARRVITGEWLDRDLPLSDVERTRVLSGPSVLTATIDPELRYLFHSDGLRVMEEWATLVYAVADDGEIRCGGILVPPVEYEDSAVRITCMGVAAYPHGFIYEDSKMWGPGREPGDPVANPSLPRPDPVVIFRDLWDYVQSFPNSDLGVVLTGTTESNQFIGTYEDPYRLRWWEVPDVGEEMDRLAEDAPFDYVERYAWDDADQTEIRTEIEVGWPRLGRPREDLRFALGENIIEPTPLASAQERANNVIGIGNGEGTRMVTSRASILDGRLRRTAVFTNKEIKGQKRLDRRVARLLQRLSVGRYEVGEIVIHDHPNAPIDAINPGDDILVQTEVPSVGEPVRQWERVIEIRQNEDETLARLTLIPSRKFQYSGTGAAGLAASGTSYDSLAPSEEYDPPTGDHITLDGDRLVVGGQPLIMEEA